MASISCCSSGRRRRGLALVTALLCLIGRGGSDFAADQAECMDQLLGLMTCLPYIQSEAAKPTPDCCTGYRDVTSKSVKCVCILIKDRNEPGLGITVNVTRAIELPSQCRSPFNASTCTSLLKLPKDSKNAKEFDQFESILEGHSSKANNNTGVRSTAAAAAAHASGGVRDQRQMSREKSGAIWAWSLLLALLVAFGG